MDAKEYSKKYAGFPTYQEIAIDAFNAGLAQNNNLKRELQLAKELKETKKELKELWKTLNDPEKCGELLAGL